MHFDLAQPADIRFGAGRVTEVPAALGRWVSSPKFSGQ
jgi:hypothetical protein